MAALVHLGSHHRCSNVGAMQEEPAGQPQDRAGPSIAPTGVTPPTGQRRDVQRRPFVALSGLHTREILKFSPMLEALGVSHTDGLEDQHV